LGQAEVLELVDQHVVPSAPHVRQHVRVGPEQLAGPGDQVIVVQQVPGAQRLRVRLEQLGVARRQRRVLEPVPSEQLQQGALALGADPEAPQHPALVIVVGDAEAAAQAGGGGVLPEQGEAQRVQGSPGDLLGGGADLPRQPGGDLVGGLVGEGEGADPGRREPLAGDEMPDPGDEAEGLAGAGAGDDENGAEGCFDGPELSVGWGQGQAGASAMAV